MVLAAPPSGRTNNRPLPKKKRPVFVVLGVSVEAQNRGRQPLALESTDVGCRAGVGKTHVHPGIYQVRSGAAAVVGIRACARAGELRRNPFGIVALGGAAARVGNVVAVAGIVEPVVVHQRARQGGTDADRRGRSVHDQVVLDLGTRERAGKAGAVNAAAAPRVCRHGIEDVVVNLDVAVGSPHELQTVRTVVHDVVAESPVGNT